MSGAQHQRIRRRPYPSVNHRKRVIVHLADPREILSLAPKEGQMLFGWVTIAADGAPATDDLAPRLVDLSGVWPTE